MRDQVDAALAVGQAHRLGRPASRRSAPTSTTSGSAPTSSSTATTSSSRPCASRSSTRCRPRARAEQRAIPAKGLTGSGYDGHVFWDTEAYVLPVLTYTAPGRGRATRCAGATRRSTSPTSGRASCASTARRSRGARSAARSARPTGRRARRRSTSTPTSPTRSSATSTPPRTRRSTREAGLELLVATARLWRSLGHHDAHGAFHIDGVTGPDEYSAIADDNVYTNLMAARNLRAAAERRRAPADEAAALGVDDEEIAPWRDAAAADARPLRRASSASTRSRRASRATDAGTSSATPAERVPAAPALPLLRPLPQAGGQAGRPRAGALPSPASTSPPRRRRATSPTTSR